MIKIKSIHINSTILVTHFYGICLWTDSSSLEKPFFSVESFEDSEIYSEMAVLEDSIASESCSHSKSLVDGASSSFLMQIE
jgi:hypothetical protein